MGNNQHPRLADELQPMQREPLLAIEKKLVIWSIVVGIVQLAVLTWESYTFFPGR